MDVGVDATKQDVSIAATSTLTLRGEDIDSIVKANHMNCQMYLSEYIRTTIIYQSLEIALFLI